MRPLDLGARTDGDNARSVYRDRRIREHAAILHFYAHTCARRPSAGDDLLRVDEEKRHCAVAITSRTREIVSGACASPRHA